MNPRIEYLYKKAGGKTSVHNLMSNPMQQRLYRELWDENIQKFAELILQAASDHIMESSDRYRKEYFADRVLKTFDGE